MNERELRSFIDCVRFTDTCWLWMYGTDRHGYGIVRWRGKYHKAHRVSYSLFVCQEILSQPKVVLDHIRELCKSKSCVNPDHLDPVTNAENASRAQRNGDLCRNGIHVMDGYNKMARVNGSIGCRACYNTAKLKAYHQNK